MTRQRAPSYLNFDKHSYPWKPGIDYRKEPGKYRVGKGEQGVLICEPYKSELTPHWRFRTPELASQSSAVLYQMFEEYPKAGDFVGADMARKFLQMGYTRARRYANFKGGIKYDKNNSYALNERGTGDPATRRKPKAPLFSTRNGNRRKRNPSTPVEKRRGVSNMDEAWLLLWWWDGQGAARVFAHEGEAILMERGRGVCLTR